MYEPKQRSNSRERDDLVLTRFSEHISDSIGKRVQKILLDEIEKAHPDVFHLLLQVLDEGQLTESLGRKVDFRNTIIIMTSNIGSRQLKDFGKGVGFETTSRNQSGNELAKSVIQKALKRSFAPEFLNRLDDVIIFNTLTKENIYEIIDIELQGLYERVHNLGYRIEISRQAKDYICDKGYDDQFGARPLKRAIQKYVEDPMAETIIKHSVKEGDQLKVDYDKNKEEITININASKKNKVEEQSGSEDQDEEGNTDLSQKAKNNKN